MNMREITYTEALNEALRICLQEDERVVLLGEDIGCYGGIFQVTKGLQEDFVDLWVQVWALRLRECGQSPKLCL
jgi:pyruvate/2-oxoglutarate/acetoin dehydrogenase E1 component